MSRKRSRLLPARGASATFAGFLCAFLASAAAGAEDISPPGDDIVGGTKVAACNWPTAVSVGGWGNCTGTLIHPRVVATAAHCGPKAGTRIYFGESSSSPGSFSITATQCAAGAQGQGGVNTNRDWAYCVLPEDARVEALPIIPVLHACEAKKFLKAGATIQAVGFGKTSGQSNDIGTKREVEIKVNSVGNGTVNVGGNGKGLCNGDSGGPIFIHLVDGANDWGWRAFGSTSGGDQSCPGGATFVTIDQHIKQIETTEMIDVTPCQDANGKWTGGPECAGFPTDPGQAGGAWPGCSAGPKTTLPIESCGPGGDTDGGSVDAGTTDAARDAARDAVIDALRETGGGGAGGNGGSAGAAGSAGRGGAGGSAGIDAGGGGSSSGAAGTAGSGAAGGPFDAGAAGANRDAAGGASGRGGATSGSSGGGAGGSAGAGDDGGCSCRVAPPRGAPATGVASLVLGLVSALRRRRARKER